MNLKEFLEENDIISEMVRTIEPDIADKELQRFIHDFLDEEEIKKTDKTTTKTEKEHEEAKLESSNIFSIAEEDKEESHQEIKFDIKEENEMLRSIIKESVFLFLEKKFQEEKANKLNIEIEEKASIPNSKRQYVNGIPFPIKEVHTIPQADDLVDLTLSEEIIVDTCEETDAMPVPEVKEIVANELEAKEEEKKVNPIGTTSTTTIENNPYPANEAKRNSKNKYILLGLLATIILSIASFFIFSDKREMPKTTEFIPRSTNAVAPLAKPNIVVENTIEQIPQSVVAEKIVSTDEASSINEKVDIDNTVANNNLPIAKKNILSRKVTPAKKIYKSKATNTPTKKATKTTHEHVYFKEQ